MESLRSPWRHAYVSSAERQAGCVLCEALEGAAPAAASAPQPAEGRSLVVHVGEACFVMMNLYPYNSGHLMVVPKRHVGRLGEATLAEVTEMMALARRLEGVLSEVYRPDGLNVGMNLGRSAGAGVADHIHLHVVPRWTGDTNFMTVVGETRVIPEDPHLACERLRAFFA